MSILIGTDACVVWQSCIIVSSHLRQLDCLTGRMRDGERGWRKLPIECPLPKVQIVQLKFDLRKLLSEIATSHCSTYVDGSYHPRIISYLDRLTAASAAHSMASFDGA